MNPDKPSREQIEARITALLLGELPAEEAELLRWTISRDPELQKLHGRLLLTVGLVREVVAHPEEASAEKAVPRTLSDERRQKLLAHFKTPRPMPKALFWLKRIEVRPLVGALAVVVLLGLLAAMVIPKIAGRSERARITAAASDMAKQKDLEEQFRAEGNAPIRLRSSRIPVAPESVPPPPAVTLTVAPTPQTEIVLPKPETTPEMQAQIMNGYVPIAGVGLPPLSPPVVAPAQSVELAAASPVPVAAETEIRVFPLKHGSPTDVAKELGSVFTKPNQQNGQNAQQVNAVADPRIQAVVVTAPKDVMNEVAGLMDELDVASDRNQAVATVQLQNSNPQQVAQTLQNMFGSSTVARNGTGSSQNSALQLRAQSTVTMSQTTTSSGNAGASGVGGGRGGRGGGGFVGGGNFGGAGGGGGGGFGGGGRGGGANPFAAQFGGGGNVQDNGTAGGAAISVDPITHNLVIVADAATQDQIKRVISQLDKPPAQRLVENGLAGRIDSFDLAEPSALPATPSSGTTFARNTVAADRSSGTDNQLGDGWHGGVVLGPIPNTGSGQTEAAANERLREVSSATSADVDAFLNKDQVASAQNFYRISGGDASQEKTPTLGDSPLIGRLFQSSSRVAGTVVAPPPAAAPAESMEGGFANSAVSETRGRLGLPVPGYTPSTAAAPARPNDGNQMVQLEGAWLPNSAVVSPPPPASATAQPSMEIADNLASPGNIGEALARKPEAAGDTLALNAANTYVANSGTLTGNNSFAGELAGNLGEAKKEAGDQSAWSLDSKVKGFSDDNFTTGATRDDANGARFLLGDVSQQKRAPLLTQSSPNDLNLNFQNAPLDKVLTDLSDKAGFIVVEGTRVNGNVTLSGNHLTQDEALNQLNSELNRNGYAAIRDGQVLTIVNKSDAKATTMPVQVSSGPTNVPNNDEMITRIVPVRFVDVQQMLAKLASAISPQATIVQNGAGNSFVITNTRQNVKRVMQLVDSLNVPPRPAATNAPVPQPEFLTRENAFSTFSMNVSDVSFKLAQASLQKGQMPDAASIRSEEFINAFNYRDPEAAAGQPLAFASELARDPFAQNRDFLRFSVKTAAAGRQPGRALNLVLLLDTSGSMERADRVAIIREALRVLASQLQPQDTVSVVTFARTARLWADGVSGDKAGATLDQVGGITPDGGTNLEEAMRLAYETAHRHYLAQGVNRVVLLTDGAANLGNVDPNVLKQKVEAQRRQGIALDCFGIGWEDFNDDLLEQLSGNGDGRYAFINSPDEAGAEFAAKLAGALQVAAQDVKVQVEFNPQRVISWRQIGYAKHQLTKEQFRDNSVLAAEIAAQEAGNALYTVETKQDGAGPIATVYVRYRIPGTQDVRERSWTVDGDGTVPALDQSSVAMKLASVAAEFSEWLAASPFAQEVTPDELLKDLSGVPQIYGADQRPAQLEWMIRQAKSLSGQTISPSQPGLSGQQGRF